MNNLTGILYIVATPIGNLQDITQRALAIFEQVDLIAAEDTRHSGLLLSHYGIKKPFFALHDHNEQQKAHLLVEKLQQGQHIALISDAGTPLISDPGFHLVRQCRQAGIKVVPIPGACAAITALCASGIASDRFCFEGFLPAKSKARCDKLQNLAEEERTLIFYESNPSHFGYLSGYRKNVGSRTLCGIGAGNYQNLGNDRRGQCGKFTPMVRRRSESH